MVQSNTTTVTYDHATESVQRKGSLYAGYITMLWPNRSHWSYYLVGPEILGYNGTWETNGNTVFYTCCEKTTKLLSYNRTLTEIGRIQLGRCCKQICQHCMISCLFFCSIFSIVQLSPKPLTNICLNTNKLTPLRDYVTLSLLLTFNQNVYLPLLFRSILTYCVSPLPVN
ncbi:unnamed protein product [Fasciola hepatica]|uniref:Uncharacterized protein n=1 Tax=Fasciola hepatica TaxID=6192 RepID=A0ABC9HGD2_FASHE|nr:unnamed protein product [Fasciola hepatica]